MAGEEISSIIDQMSSASLEDSGRICCICRDHCVNPVKLPCQHIFCYLCLKGITARNNRCALCRQTIPVGFIDQPVLLNKDELKKKVHHSDLWFYKARNGGWWMYEQRVAEEIEKAYSHKEDQAHVQISGYSYTIDLINMVQYRNDRPERKRHIRRGGVSEECIKGVAGIWIEGRLGEKEETKGEVETTTKTKRR